jgi:hypothetical protein
MNKLLLEKYNGFLFAKTSPKYLYEAIARNDIASVKHALSTNDYKTKTDKIYFIPEIRDLPLASDSSIFKAYIIMYASLSNNLEIVKMVSEHLTLGATNHISSEILFLLDFIRKNNISIEIYEYLDNFGFMEKNKEFLNEPDCREDIKRYYQQEELKKKFVKILKEGSSQDFLNTINEFLQTGLSINSKFDNKSLLEYAIEREFSDVIEVLLKSSGIDVPLSFLDLVKCNGKDSDKILEILCDYFNEIGTLRNFADHVNNKTISSKIINYIFDSAQKQMSSMEISNKRSRS